MEKYGDRVLPVVDACQTRMVDSGMSDLVSAGCAVLATGSKFYGGPPFCGVAILPAAMARELNNALEEGAPGDLRGKVAASKLGAYINASLVPDELVALKEVLPNDAPNLGLLVRWQMAMHNIDRYHQIPDDERCRLRIEWMTETAQMIRAKALETVRLYEEAPSLEDRRLSCGMHSDGTILCLDLCKPAVNGGMMRLNLGEARRVHNLMARDLSGMVAEGAAESKVLRRRCFLAQPVALTSAGPNVLRAAVGAPLVLRLHEGKDRVQLRREDEEWVEKMDLILRMWDSLPC